MNAEQVRARAEQFLSRFTEAGAVHVETAVLQPADLLLDLYGEDIRARAFVTRDPVRGEFMLRPDYTVPVARMVMETGGRPARFAYLGPVWRMQPPDSDRPAETLQVGYEIFGNGDRAAADAELFGLFCELLAPAGLTVTVGDMGILLAAVDSLETHDRRKAALRRHLWRPNRFRRLLDGFSGARPDESIRPGLRRESGDQPPPLIGLRSEAEIEARLAELAAEAASPPVGPDQVKGLEAVLNFRGTMTSALAELEELTGVLPALSPAIDVLSNRRDVMRSVGINIDHLRFSTGHGRRSMEYYDGFVFGFESPQTRGTVPVASGGRYDALTGILGGGTTVPAVGGVIRPEVLLACKEGAAWPG